MRTKAPELVAVGSVALLTIVSGVASGFVGSLLPWRFERLMVWGIEMMAIALVASFSLLVVVLVDHVRRADGLWAALVRVVQSQDSSTQRWLRTTTLYLWVIAAFLGGLASI
jgi:hypothetical protein